MPPEQPTPIPIEKKPETTLPPTTTVQQDLTTSGQRTINLLWETVQGIIALTVTGAIIFIAIKGIASEQLSNAFFLIIGFYFSRTNHSAIGGIGPKPLGYYTGR
jgi:hypothetical protein